MLLSISLYSIKQRISQIPQVELVHSTKNWSDMLDSMLSDDKRKEKSAGKVLMLMSKMAEVEISAKSTSTPSCSWIENTFGSYFRKFIFHKLFTPVKRGYSFNEDNSALSTHSVINTLDFVYKLINSIEDEVKKSQLFQIFKETFGNLHDYFMQKLSQAIEVAESVIAISSFCFKLSIATYKKIQAACDLNKFKKIEKRKSK